MEGTHGHAHMTRVHMYTVQQLGVEAQHVYVPHTHSLLSRPNTGYGKEHGGGGTHKRGDS